MKELKKTILYAFFCIEMAMFLFFYAFGTHGIYVLQQVSHENDILRREIEHMQDEIQRLEDDCGAWKHSAFYKEKIARERLQMARTDDIIYYID